MVNEIYYWDNSFDEVMIEVDLKESEITEKSYIIEHINKLKQVHDIYKKGYIDISKINDVTVFEQLKKHLTSTAFRYSVIKRKPFIIMKIKYQILNEEELKCMFEWLIHTPEYLNAVKYHDTLYFAKIGWWLINDAIEKYKPIIKFGTGDYNYDGEFKW